VRLGSLHIVSSLLACGFLAGWLGLAASAVTLVVISRGGMVRGYRLGFLALLAVATFSVIPGTSFTQSAQFVATRQGANYMAVIAISSLLTCMFVEWGTSRRSDATEVVDREGG
jgi:hypothetical protein